MGTSMVKLKDYLSALKKEHELDEATVAGMDNKLAEKRVL